LPARFRSGKNGSICLPAAIGKLENLEMLNISHNDELTFLPDSIVKLR